MQTLKECMEVGKGSWVLVGGDCFRSRFWSETAGVCMEAVQGVSLSCPRAYFV